MSNSSIWPIDKTLSGATFPGQSGPGQEFYFSTEMQSVYSTALDDKAY